MLVANELQEFGQLICIIRTVLFTYVNTRGHYKVDHINTRELSMSFASFIQRLKAVNIY